MAGKKTKKGPWHIRKALSGEIKLPQVVEIGQHFIELAGGGKEFAKMLYLEFRNAPVGGIARQRILDSILRTLNAASEMMGPMEELDLLSDDDLTRELESVMQEIPDGESEARPGDLAQPDGPAQT